MEAGSTDEVLVAPQEEYTQALLSAIPTPGWTPQRHRDAVPRDR